MALVILVPSPQLEEAIDEVPVDSIRALVGASGLAAKSLHPSFSVASTPVAKRSPIDPEEFTDLRSPISLLEVLFDGVQSETYILLDQSDPFPGAAMCPHDSGGKMSGHCTATSDPSGAIGQGHSDDG